MRFWTNCVCSLVAALRFVSVSKEFKKMALDEVDCFCCGLWKGDCRAVAGCTNKVNNRIQSQHKHSVLFWSDVSIMVKLFCWIWFQCKGYVLEGKIYKITRGVRQIEAVICQSQNKRNHCQTKLHRSPASELTTVQGHSADNFHAGTIVFSYASIIVSIPISVSFSNVLDFEHTTVTESIRQSWLRTGVKSTWLTGPSIPTRPVCATINNITIVLFFTTT